jgi:hypothetical protein
MFMSRAGLAAFGSAEPDAGLLEEVRVRFENEFRFLSVALAADERVRKELNLDVKQQDALQAAIDAYAIKKRDLSNLITTRKSLSGESQELLDKIHAKEQQLAQEAVISAINAVLNADQRTRLGQIALQRRFAGHVLLWHPQVKDELQLSTEQVERIARLVEAQAAFNRDEMQPLRNRLEEARGDSARLAALAAEERAARKKVEEHAAETSARILNILSDQQRAQFEKMKGEKLDLPNLRLPIAPAGSFGKR